MPVDPDRENEILLAAIHRSPAERSAYLEQACGTDAELLERVRALIQAHDESTGALQQAVVPDDALQRLADMLRRHPDQANLKGQLAAGRRNHGRVLAGALLLIALVGGVLGTTVGLLHARLEQHRADAALGRELAASDELRQSLGREQRASDNLKESLGREKTATDKLKTALALERQEIQDLKA